MYPRQRCLLLLAGLVGVSAAAAGCSGSYSRVGDAAQPGGDDGGDDRPLPQGSGGRSGAGGGTIAGSGGAGAGGGGGGAGTGGSVAGTGGSVTGTGGSVTGTGGSVAGTGGSVAGTGGSVTGTGGSVTGTGGSVAGTGGSVTGTGGDGTGGTGTGGDGTGGAGTGGAGTGGAGTGGTSTSIISVDFVGGAMGGAGGAIVMTATETAGVKPAARWNAAQGAMGTLSSLLASDGTAPGAAISWMAPFTAPNPGIWRVGYTDAAGNTRMMNGYLDPASTANAAATITVSALPAAFTASGYDVYVYVYGNVPSGETRSFQFSMTGTTTTFTVTQVGPTDVASGFPGFVEVTTSGGAGSYVVFRNLSAASFTLTATPGTASMPQRRRCPVNGLQIVAPSGS